MSRLSAVELGYLEDPFAQYFVSPDAQITRRLPIINRGTFVRTSALDRLVDQFLRQHVFGESALAGGQIQENVHNAQIISLGAGTDTRAFRLFTSKGRKWNQGRDVPPYELWRNSIVYHEIDFPRIVEKKLATVRQTSSLKEALPDPNLEQADGSWKSCGRPPNGSEFWCHGLDLRDLSRETDLPRLDGLRTDIPTLLISECCLCYLETSEASNVIKFFKDRIPQLGIVLYEPVKPDDPFGKQMVSNLAARGIRMPTLEVYKEPKDQEDRLRAAGWEVCCAYTVEKAWEEFILQDDQQRVDSLEGLDEVEEWKLLAGHYVIAWAHPSWDMGMRWDDNDMKYY